MVISLNIAKFGRLWRLAPSTSRTSWPNGRITPLRNYHVVRLFLFVSGDRRVQRLNKSLNKEYSPGHSKGAYVILEMPLDSLQQRKCAEELPRMLADALRIHRMEMAVCSTIKKSFQGIFFVVLQALRCSFEPSSPRNRNNS